MTDPKPNCLACRYSYMEPDDDLTCGHPDAGPMGQYTSVAAAQDGHCGADHPKFEQHPLRNPDGTLKKSFEIAPQTLIDSLGPYVARVLEAIGHPEAMVTDESWVSDFRPLPAKGATMAESRAEVHAFCNEVSQKLGFKVESQDTIYGLAARLRGTS
jgi:hypothetical protein